MASTLRFPRPYRPASARTAAAGLLLAGALAALAPGAARVQAAPVQANNAGLQGPPAGFAEQGRVTLEIMVRREGSRRLRPLAAVDRLRKGDILLVTGPKGVIRGSEGKGEGWQLVVGFCSSESGRIRREDAWRAVYLKPENFDKPHEFPVPDDEYSYPVLFLVADHREAGYQMITKQAEEADRFFNVARNLTTLALKDQQLSAMERFLDAFESSPEAKDEHWRERVASVLQDMGFKGGIAELEELKRPSDLTQVVRDLRGYVSDRGNFTVEKLTGLSKKLLGPQVGEIADLFVSVANLVRAFFPKDTTYEIQPALADVSRDQPGRLTLILGKELEKGKERRSILMFVPFLPGVDDRAPRIEIVDEEGAVTFRKDAPLLIQARGTAGSLCHAKLDRDWMLSLSTPDGQVVRKDAVPVKLTDTGSFLVSDTNTLWQLFGPATELRGELAGQWSWEEIRTEPIRLVRAAAPQTWVVKNDPRQLVAGSRVQLELRAQEPVRVQSVALGETREKASVLAQDLSTDAGGALTLPLDLGSVAPGEKTLFIQQVGVEAPVPLRLCVLEREPRISVRLFAGGPLLLAEGQRIELVRSIAVGDLQFEPDKAEPPAPKPAPVPGQPAPPPPPPPTKRRFRAAGGQIIPDAWLQSPPKPVLTLADAIETPRTIDAAGVEVRSTPRAAFTADPLQRDPRFHYDFGETSLLSRTTRTELTLDAASGYRFLRSAVVELGTKPDGTEVEKMLALDRDQGLDVRENRVRITLALGEKLGPRAFGRLYYRIRESAEESAPVGEWQEAPVVLARFPELEKLVDDGSDTVVLWGKELSRIESVSSDGKRWVRLRKEPSATDGFERARIPRTDASRFWIRLEDAPEVNVRVMLKVEPSGQ